MSSEPEEPAPRALVTAAFAAVYILWGSTYLGMRIAIETIPPLTMAGTRFLCAGLMLYAAMRLRGAAPPRPFHWKGAAFTGAFLLLGGNGGVAWATQTVPSGTVALAVAVVPMWMVLFNWLRPGGKRPTGWIGLGLLAGFTGVGLLVLSKDSTGRGLIDPVGAFALFFATVSWAIGSVGARSFPRPSHTLVYVGMQMMVGGSMLLSIAFAIGEWNELSTAALTIRSVIAFLYLMIFGALIGYSAYSFLLHVSTPARVSTFAYVNPLIAVVLGYLILDEPVPNTLLIAAGLIVGAVILINRSRSV